MGPVALRGLIALTALGAQAAAAHETLHDAAPWPGNVEPWVLVCLAVSLAAYVGGITRLWRHAGRGRGIGVARVAAFGGGWLALATALASPVDAWAARLFWVHMLQHELLMVVAAPLLVLGRPLAAWAWALPLQARRRVGALFHRRAWRAPWLMVTAPLSAWLWHAAALWLWHVPAVFDAALAHTAVHVAQHLSFLFSALLFWWSVLGPATRRAQGLAVVSVFTTMLHTAALGALLALSSFVWYASYAASAPLAGWDALADQQLGGLVMWAPAGLAYLAAGLALAARWIGVQAHAAA